MDEETIEKLKHFLIQYTLISALVMGGYFVAWGMQELLT